MPGWAAAAVVGSQIVGGLIGGKSSSSNFGRNANLQRDFAQHGVRWRVADAKAAGIHPLYAMGANLPSAAPIQAGDTGTSKRQVLGRAIESAGQSVGNYLSRREQVANQRIATTQGQENARLQNMYLHAQIVGQGIQNRDNAVSRPGIPGGASLIPGQGSTNLQYGSTQGGTGGAIATNTDPTNPKGYHILLPGEAPHQTMEDTIVGESYE